MNDLVSLNPGLHFYHTQDPACLLGNIDNTHYSLHFTVGVGNHSFTGAYQRVNGNTPFAYIIQGDSVYLDNSQQYFRLQRPERALGEAQYAYDFAGVGVPGLTSSVSYSRGTVDLTKVDPDSKAIPLVQRRWPQTPAWERDLDLQYVCKRSAKGSGGAPAWATNRGGNGLRRD